MARGCSGSNFIRKSDVGAVGEEFVKKLLRNAGIEAQRSREIPSLPAKFLDWDIQAKLEGREFTLEVKFDLEEVRTHNLFIEYYNTKLGKPSGLHATKADLWVHLFQPFSAFVTSVANLRNFTTTVTPLRHISSGGDDNAAGMLYKRDVILPAIFHPMDDLAPAELKQLLVSLLGGENG